MLKRASNSVMARFSGTAVTATLALALVFVISTGSAAPSGVVAFVDVTVIPMSRDELRPHQTVLVEGDRIVAIGPSDTVRVPRGARKITGANRYLLPGLIDMHVHFHRQPSDSDAPHGRLPDYRERNDDIGVLFVANGAADAWRSARASPDGQRGCPTSAVRRRGALTLLFARQFTGTNSLGKT